MNLLYIFACWITLSMLLMPSAGVFFSKLTFSNISLGTLSLIRESNDLDPDQDQRSVGAKLGPECLQRL